MSIIKGFPSADKVLKGNGLTANYATLQPVGGRRHAMDTVAQVAVEASTGLTVEAGSKGNVIITNSHTAREGDFIKILTPSDLSGGEVAIVEIIDANTFRIGIQPTIDVVGATYDLFRYETQTQSSGAGAAADGKVAKYNVSLPTNVDNTTVWLQTDVNGILLVNTDGAAAAQPDVIRTVLNDFTLNPLVVNVENEILGDTGAVAGTQLHIFDSSGWPYWLYIGPQGSPTSAFYIVPGGQGLIPCLIPANSRIALELTSAQTPSPIDVGEMYLTVIG